MPEASTAVPETPIEEQTRDANRRDKDIIPLDELKEVRPVVIGVGAIGGQVAKQLAHMGVQGLDIIDPDDVGWENLATQGFEVSMLHLSKVFATKRACMAINPELTVAQHHEKFKPEHLPIGRTAIFMCVDDMDARIEISKACKEEPFFVDGRMSAEVVRVLSVTDRESYDKYRKTLFPSSEAYQETCTAKATIYTANIAAGLMLAQFTKWLRGFPLTHDFELNMLSMELCDNDREAESD